MCAEYSTVKRGVIRSLMLTLLKGISCRCDSEKKDLILAEDKIFRILPAGELKDISLIERVIPCDGLLAFPGLIDQHVHFLGGGGEQGFASRVREPDIREFICAGITTAVGLLGADGYTRTMEALFARAKALEAAGITTYLYSGSYTLPCPTLTGSLTRDLLFVDKIIGAGEIAISDHRSSQPDLNALIKLGAEAHLGGLLSGKAGVVHLHVGEGKGGLTPLLELIKASDLPQTQFVPTHMNRTPALFHQAIKYCRSGGNIDLTAGETAGIPVPRAIAMLLEEEIDLSRVTISSDGGGSIPSGGVSGVQALYDDFRACIVQSVLAPDEAAGLVSEHVAKVLGLYPRKGSIAAGSDADLVITDQEYNLQMLISMGKILVENGCPVQSQPGGREENHG